MKKSKLLSIAAALALAASVLSTPANAIFRAYVASDGSDANPCTLPQPCRLLPAALAAVDVGGEIWMLDSANYNAAQVEVTKSVSILAIPGALGSVVAIGGGNGLNINTAGVKVSLRNLVIVQLGAGNFGIWMGNGSELTILNSEIANHPGMAGGIFVGAFGAKVTIKDTIVRNSNVGIYLDNGVAAVLDRVRVENNANMGIYVGNSRIAINNSVITGSPTGMFVYAGAANQSYATVSRSEISKNGTGIDAQAFVLGDVASLVVYQSSLSHNTTTAINLFQNMGVSTATLDGNVFAHNQSALVAAGGAAAVSRGNNTLRNNVGGDALVAGALAGQ